MLYLGNSFSIQMLNIDEETNIRIAPIERHVVADTLSLGDWRSVIGHQDTANVVSDDLGMEVKYNREFITLTENDLLFVAQIEGGRLPEGATTIPEGYSLNYYIVEVV